jgi:hypothetical protein
VVDTITIVQSCGICIHQRPPGARLSSAMVTDRFLDRLMNDGEWKKDTDGKDSRHDSPVRLRYCYPLHSHRPQCRSRCYHSYRVHLHYFLFDTTPHLLNLLGHNRDPPPPGSGRGSSRRPVENRHPVRQLRPLRLPSSHLVQKEDLMIYYMNESTVSDVSLRCEIREPDANMIFIFLCLPAVREHPANRHEIPVYSFV